MSKSNSGWRIGVDVGGTFTDLVVAAGEAPLHVIKVPSVPANPADGVLRAIRVAAEALGVSTTRLLQECSLFVHGSTIATNTLLEQKGATVGLLTTSGFRDGLETRRGMRDNPWEHRDPGPKILVPRRLRLPVRGRMDSLGNEIVSLEIQDVKAAAESFLAQDVESVAICFLHSYANAAHEKATAELLRHTLGLQWVSVSSDISPLSGEFERTSTAVVNAY